jgi:hypothetical protein
MKKNDRFRQTAYTRFHALSVDHRDKLEASDGGKQAVADLGDSVDAVDQRSQERQQRLEEERVATKECRSWRRILRDALRAVVQVSRSIVPADATAEVLHTPGRVNDEDFLAEAGAIQDKVKAHESEFVAHGLHPDVLKALANGIDGLAAARLEREKARALRVAAGKSIRDDLARARAAVALLHTIATTTPGVDPNVVNAFRAAKRIGPSKAKEEAPAQPDPVPVPTSKTA